MVEAKINDLIAIRNALQRNLLSCKNLQNHPMLDRVYVEYFPKRKIFYFDIEPYNFAVQGENSKNYWKKALHIVSLAVRFRPLFQYPADKTQLWQLICPFSPVGR